MLTRQRLCSWLSQVDVNTLMVLRSWLSWKRLPMARSLLWRKVKGSAKQQLEISKLKTGLVASNERCGARTYLDEIPPRRTWKIFLCLLPPACIGSLESNLSCRRDCAAGVIKLSPYIRRMYIMYVNWGITWAWYMMICLVLKHGSLGYLYSMFWTSFCFGCQIAKPKRCAKRATATGAGVVMDLVKSSEGIDFPIGPHAHEFKWLLLRSSGSWSVQWKGPAIFSDLYHGFMIHDQSVNLTYVYGGFLK